MHYRPRIDPVCCMKKMQWLLQEDVDNIVFLRKCTCEFANRNWPYGCLWMVIEHEQVLKSIRRHCWPCQTMLVIEWLNAWSLSTGSSGELLPPHQEKGWLHCKHQQRKIMICCLICFSFEFAINNHDQSLVWIKPSGCYIRVCQVRVSPISHSLLLVSQPFWSWLRL